MVKNKNNGQNAVRKRWKETVCKYDNARNNGMKHINFMAKYNKVSLNYNFFLFILFVLNGEVYSHFMCVLCVCVFVWVKWIYDAMTWVWTVLNAHKPISYQIRYEWPTTSRICHKCVRAYLQKTAGNMTVQQHQPNGSNNNNIKNYGSIKNTATHSLQQ